MDTNLMNTNIAEKIADIFQSYTEIILCEKPQGHYVSLQLMATGKCLYYLIIIPSCGNKESVIDLTLKDIDGEYLMSELRKLEQVLDAILKEIRK